MKPVFEMMMKQQKINLDTCIAWSGKSDVDVGDNTYDVLVAVCLPDNIDPKDAYDVCLGKMNRGIQAIRLFDDYYGPRIVADVTGWVKENFELLKEFCREFNGDAYQMDVAEEDQYYEEDDPLYVGVLTWESLVVGNYSDKAYKWLAERL